VAAGACLAAATAEAAAIRVTMVRTEADSYAQIFPGFSMQDALAEFLGQCRRHYKLAP